METKPILSPLSSFRAGTGMLGATEPGQKVTPENIGQLPPGSVVRLNDGGRIIHLHDDLWLWCCDCAWCYDTVDRHFWRLQDGATLCHIPTA